MASYAERGRAAFERFLWAPADARSAGVFRVLLAAMLVFVFWSAGAETPLPARVLGTTWLGEVTTSPAYAALVVLFAAAFGMGLGQRWSGFALALLLVPLSYLGFGRESRRVLWSALLAFCCMRSGPGLGELARGGPAARLDAGPIWPIRLIQIELSLVYGVNALAKATPQYLSGDVLVGMSRTLPNFVGDLRDGVLYFGPIALPVAAAAASSVAVEAFLAVGFWFRRVRWLTAFVGVAFHAGLTTILSIHRLDVATMFLYLAFLFPWQGSAARAARPVGATA